MRRGSKDRLNALNEGLALALFLWAALRFLPGSNPTWASVGLPAFVWFALRALAGSRLADDASRRAIGSAVAGWAVFAYLYARWAGGPADSAACLLAFYGGALLFFLYALRRRRGVDGMAEAWRWLAVAAVGAWLMRYYITTALRGAGDAQWYANMMADMLEQVRAGVFPVYVGQSAYQFNGAIYPLRIAPGFHYLGAALDLATFRVLGPMSVLNLLLSGLGVATALICYLCLAALAPRRRNLAAVAALLFLACPGVIGMPYSSDLYMSWTTVPAVCLALYACVRTFFRATWREVALLAGALGVLWWGHTPIAMWTTAWVSLAQCVRWVRGWSGRRSLGPELIAAIVFLTVAGYPLVSVLVATPEAGHPIKDFQGGDPGIEASFVQSAFPAVLEPVSASARELSDLQLGYTLWAALLLTVGVSFRRREAVTLTFALAALSIVVLLTPIPGLNALLWRWVPTVIRNTTGNWPMNRLYLILAGLVTFAAWRAIGLAGPQRRGVRVLAGASLLVLTGWSLFQANRFVLGDAGRDPSSGPEALRSENALLTRFSYLLFPALPAYFSHGTVEPLLENRLFARDTHAFLTGNQEQVEAMVGDAFDVVSQGEMGTGDTGTHSFSLQPGFLLEPGRRYALLLQFREPTREGAIVLHPEGFGGFYLMPEFGNALSFGSSAGHSHLLALHTSLDRPESFHLEFRTLREAPLGLDFSHFAHYVFMSYDPARLPVNVTSLIPYRAQVSSPRAAWLETPRMYQDAYQAIVNARRVPVAKSPEGLVMIPVPAGRSTVKLQYYPPFVLAAAFWVSFAAVVATTLALAGLLWHDLDPRAAKTAPGP